MIAKIAAIPILAFVITAALLFSHGHPAPLPVPVSNLPEAPTGFDTLTNGFTSQTNMDADRDQFEEDATLPALGPFYNARSCADCHDNPVSGGNSQVSEHRISPETEKISFETSATTRYAVLKRQNVAAATLIHDRSVDPEAQQKAPYDMTNALRMSLSLMGDGFVEQIPDKELLNLAQKNGGQAILVPVLESDGKFAVGRFGWKCQHASLLSFAADADFNEKGVENRLVMATPPQPSNGIEDNDNPAPGKPEDIDFYAEMMRSLKAPSRGPITAQVMKGEVIFLKIGCGNCHTKTMTTPTVQFHPFGDFLLHDVGTGDGIHQGLAPANKVRTPPLWGLRTRPRLLHDGSAMDIPAAIERHKEEARDEEKQFDHLSKDDQKLMLVFLNSL